MKKPTNYDKVQTGEFVPVELGGHHAIIKSAREQQSKTGKPMVVVAIDFAKNDVQPGYFADQFDKDIRPEKKWPFQAVQYIVSEDKDGNCSKSFKSFINAFEKSNGCEATWGDAFCAQFKNKKIGVVFGEVEEEYNGEVKTRRRIRWFCSDDAAEAAKIPDKQTLVERPAAKPAASKDESWMNVPDTSEEALPF